MSYLTFNAAVKVLSWRLECTYVTTELILSSWIKL